jgi:hypothetical protein
MDTVAGGLPVGESGLRHRVPWWPGGSTTAGCGTTTAGCGTTTGRRAAPWRTTWRTTFGGQPESLKGFHKHRVNRDAARGGVLHIPGFEGGGQPHSAGLLPVPVRGHVRRGQRG